VPTPRRDVRAALVLLVLLSGGVGAAEKQLVTDAAGRRVEVPARIERVYAAGGPATLLVFALAPDKLLGWARPLTADERAYLPPKYGELPTLGRLTGRGNTASVETVLAARPDLILDYGSLGATYSSLADRVQQQTGVPYVIFEGSFSAMPATLTAVGELLGVRERGVELGRYAQRVLAETDRLVASIPADKRPRVYLARGPRGLETASAGSINAESLERLGARNVADTRSGGGLGAVSLEQVLAWDPDVIVAMDPAFAADVRADVRWRHVRAVREGRVHVVPQLPFPWVDFPPSVNRLIGLPWLARVLYPDRAQEDLRRATRTFYALFYQRAPSEGELDALLGSLARAQR
jgi:iron complex transport system substrate-binding protein